MLFDTRINAKPFEYDVESFKNAILHSFWIKDEYNYSGDIQDYKVNMTEQEKSITKKCMLAISQIEVCVKSFRSNLNLYIPKAEIANVGAVFGCNEVVHFDFYSHLLELLGLNKEFELLLKNNIFIKRYDAIQEGMKGDFIDKLVFFTLFTENVSLFSQFFCLMSINKHKMYLNGMSMGISASCLEERTHAQFGGFLINIIRKEYPGMITQTKVDAIKEMVDKCVSIEQEIIDWIFEQGDTPYLKKETVKQYIEYRTGVGMDMIGIPYKKVSLPQEAEWFDAQLFTTSHVDFFHKKNPNYSKRTQSVDANDLF